MIEIIFLDVDGCLTDGKIVYSPNGDELKFFDVKDGYAIESWLKLGKKSRSSRAEARPSSKKGRRI